MLLKVLFFFRSRLCVAKKHRNFYNPLFLNKVKSQKSWQQQKYSIKDLPKNSTNKKNINFFLFPIIILLVFLIQSLSIVHAATQCSANIISAQQQNAPNKLIKKISHASTVSTHATVNTKQYTYKIIKRLPHDKQAFTQGLVFQKNVLYESTGLLGQSEIRKLDISSGAVMQAKKLEQHYFGEGISIIDDKIVQLTLGTENVFIYDLKNLQQINNFKFNGEGWGITNINERLLISDGSATLKWLNNKSKKLNDIHVTENGVEMQGLNELEYANGYIYANVWPGDCIAQINPANGNVDAWINLGGLYRHKARPHWTAILNGVAYRRDSDTFFVTGKYWPYIYELKFLAADKSEPEREPEFGQAQKIASTK